jgi:hypothetical protein
MLKFQYKAEYYRTYNTTIVDKEVEVPLMMTGAKQLADDLPQKGEEGWELVTVANEGFMGLWAYFKRSQNFITESKTPGPASKRIAKTMVPKAQATVEIGGPVLQTTTTQPQTLPELRDFPSRDFSTGYQKEDPVCAKDGCRGCRLCQRY